MFNFKELKLDRGENTENSSSFVGIRRSNNELEFRLPKGFQNFPDEDFEATKKLFFRMYRTFKKFERDNLSLSPDKKSAGKDNIETKGNAYIFKDKEDNEVLLYSKIAVIENLLEAYQDLALDVIERRIGRNEKIDYSKIDRYLHHAIYLPNDVIYLDEMDLPRQTLHYDSATIIDLFCFILQELENELEQDTDNRVQELANRFKEQHLSYDQSLFNEETFETTITTLKDVLDDIDKRTAYKDEDYWRLYEAIESFLYGELDMQNTHEDGIFWGISNFWQIWEDMCNTYAFANFNKLDEGLRILFADTNIVFNGQRVANNSFGGHKVFKAEDFENPFFIDFRSEKRWLRPDLLRINYSPIYKDIVTIKIIGEHGKYIDFSVYPRDKVKNSAFKQLCANIKSSITHNHLRSRAIGENNFKNYPKDELEKRLKLKVFKNADKFVLLDWKYMNERDFLTNSKKLNDDIIKQLCYEFCAEKYQTQKEAIDSQFIIPFFYDNKSENIGDFIENKLLYQTLQSNNISVFNANFMLIQSIYLKS
jgi:hypothetical protein